MKKKTNPLQIHEEYYREQYVSSEAENLSGEKILSDQPQIQVRN